MDNFTNIGKAVLIQALGIQKNYTEITESYVDVIDYSNPACNGCKCKAILDSFDAESNPYKNAVTICSNCPNRTYTQKTISKKIYHNEKNRYGYRPMLKNNAIKLFLLLHFYHPDRFGIIRNISVQELAKELECNIKTVWNNLEILQNYTYISYTKTAPYSINLLICDYEQYYLPANKNGRGFLVLSLELLHKIINIPSLITLRIFLRELLNLDNPNLKGQVSVDYKSIKEIRNTLPPYCKPCIIKKAISNVSEIFDISIENNLIRFEINDRYIAKKQKEELRILYINQLNDFMYDFNSYVPVVNNEHIPPDQYINFFNSDCLHDTYKLIVLSKTDIDDLAGIAVHYSYNLLMDALSKIYCQYVLYDRKITNLPGLVLTFIRSELNTSDSAA